MPSPQHLNELLFSDDADVLEALLRLMQKPAQRLSQQRHLKSSLSLSQQRMLTLASSWNTKEAGLDLPKLARRDTEIPEELTTVSYQFYRTASDITEVTKSAGEKSAPSASTSASAPHTPRPAYSLDSKSGKATPVGKGKEPEEPSTPTAGTSKPAPVTEGMVLVTGPVSGKSDRQILLALVDEFAVPEHQKFALLHRIRVTKAIVDPDKRLQMLRIRLLAIGALGGFDVFAAATVCRPF